jgi:predicted nucleic-acid-binding Zn-ribbon protein
MIRCTKCDNETRTSGLVTASGDVMLAGTIGTDPQPILAQVCSACGYIELYAPQPLQRPEAETSHTKENIIEPMDETPALAL